MSFRIRSKKEDKTIEEQVQLFLNDNTIKNEEELRSVLNSMNSSKQRKNNGKNNGNSIRKCTNSEDNE